MKKVSDDANHKESVHKSVLLNEIITGLNPQKGIIYLDGTLGGAGHALAFAEACKGDLTIIGLDRDPGAIARDVGDLKDSAKVVILEIENFRNLDKVLTKHKIAKVDRILLDLGLSSDELEHSGRGFTFQKEEPLLMTLGDPATYPFTAYTIVNSWAEEDIANVIFGYGEDRDARRIARAILHNREKKPIETTTELAEIVRMAVMRKSRNQKSSGIDFRKRKVHPATKTFQALRIAVNDELNALREGLEKGYEALSGGGRIAVISFHSLEDRIVKNFFKAKGGSLTKKPIIASDEEIALNPRARSAKLRILEKNR